MFRSYCSAALTMLGLTGVACADTIYVSDQCGDDTWSGQIPKCTATVGPKKTIQAGIDAALGGDEVVVANGDYRGAGNKNLDFHGKLITVRSASGVPEDCVINCEGAGRGFIFQTGETAEAVVEGLRIFNGSDGFLSGGAISILFSSPTIANCQLLQCHASGNGGAISHQRDNVI